MLAFRRSIVSVQAAFRGWSWRLHTLYNPHTDVGHAHAMLQWSKLTTQVYHAGNKVGHLPAMLCPSLEGVYRISRSSRLTR